ncbi:MAG TPA: hypothetical protein DCM62_04430 [Bacteroidales bacterium]|nr:hypothetical protein [Bacteroidales bacterium]
MTIYFGLLVFLTEGKDLCLSCNRDASLRLSSVGHLLSAGTSCNMTIYFGLLVFLTEGKDLFNFWVVNFANNISKLNKFL